MHWAETIRRQLPIDSPVNLFAFLAAIVALVLWLSELRALRGFFRYFPPLIWTYFVPMFCSTLGIIPNSAEEQPLYGFILKVILPVVIVLLLVPTEARSIARLGPKAVIAMLIGTAGIVIGAAASFGFFQSVLPAGTLPPGTWKGISALSASWIGGSPNMAAVAVSLDTDGTLFGKMVVVDTVCAYTWLGILVGLTAWQERFDRSVGADSRVVRELSERLSARQASSGRAIRMVDFVTMLAVGFVVAQVCLHAGGWIAARVEQAEAAGGVWRMLRLSQVLSGFGWGVLLITATSIALSFTRLRGIGDSGATSVGNAGLYLLLTTFGAQADLRLIEVHDLWLFAIGAVWLLIHIAVLLVGVRLLRAPLFMAATASMANVGGTASAPVVAAAFHPSLAPVGLLMAILGGILGTPVALLVVAKICAAIGA